MLLSLLLLAAPLAALAQSPEDGVIRSAVPWIDSSGNRVYAGGANLYEEGGVYYLVGEGKKVLSGDCSDCFNLYKSTDLEHWDYVSCILKNEDIVGPSGFSFPWRMERPKIFKCPSGGYRMWFHCDTPSFAIQSVGVLTADSVTGPYTFAGPCFKPDGQKSYDMGTFVDEAERGGDGHSYLIRSVNNQFAGISQMTEDCMNVTGIVSQGPDMEGQAIMRDSQGALHAAGSHLTGWASNAAIFVTSPNASLVGAQWGPSYNPSSSSNTYDSQSTFIYPYKHADGHVTHIWMADRWNANGPGGLDNMTNIWLPLVPPTNGSTPGYNGVEILEAVCDPSSPQQRFSMPVGGSPGPIVHAASALCLQGTTSGQSIALGDCSAKGSAWVAGANFGITDGVSGSACLGVNAQDDVVHVPGNPVVAWQCSAQPAWNEQWLVPSPGATGVIQARLQHGGGPSNLCLAAAPNTQPQWTLPWMDAWSLKDF